MNFIEVIDRKHVHIPVIVQRISMTLAASNFNLLVRS